MVASIDGLDFNTLMNLPFDEYLIVRGTVIEISEKRKGESKSMRRGR